MSLKPFDWHLTLINSLPLFPSAVLIQNMNRTQVNQNPRYFENNYSNFYSVFWENKTIQNRNLSIIGTQLKNLLIRMKSIEDPLIQKYLKRI